MVNYPMSCPDCGGNVYALFYRYKENKVGRSKNIHRKYCEKCDKMFKVKLVPESK